MTTLYNRADNDKLCQTGDQAQIEYHRCYSLGSQCEGNGQPGWPDLATGHIERPEKVRGVRDAHAQKNRNEFVAQVALFRAQ